MHSKPKLVWLYVYNLCKLKVLKFIKYNEIERIRVKEEKMMNAFEKKIKGKCVSLRNRGYLNTNTLCHVIWGIANDPTHNKHLNIVAVSVVLTIKPIEMPNGIPNNKFTVDLEYSLYKRRVKRRLYV